MLLPSSFCLPWEGPPFWCCDKTSSWLHRAPSFIVILEVESCYAEASLSLRCMGVWLFALVLENRLSFPSFLLSFLLRHTSAGLHNRIRNLVTYLYKHGTTILYSHFFRRPDFPLTEKAWEGLIGKEDVVQRRKCRYEYHSSGVTINICMWWMEGLEIIVFQIKGC